MKRNLWLFRLLKTAVVLFCLWLLVWYFFFRGPVAYSDVPVTPEVCWWPYQDRLNVTEFDAEAVDPNLNLFSHLFLVRFHIRGTIRASKKPQFETGWRPKIVKVQLTSRMAAHSNFDEQPNRVDTRADVLVVPIIAVVKDEQYKGEEVPFDLTIQHVFSSMDWGKNYYDCKCGDKAVSVSVAQLK